MTWELFRHPVIPDSVGLLYLLQKQFLKLSFPEAGEIAQLVKCLPHKHRDLSSSPSEYSHMCWDTGSQLQQGTGPKEEVRSRREGDTKSEGESIARVFTEKKGYTLYTL